MQALNAVDDTFAPELPFTLDPIVLKLSDASSAAPELAKAEAPPVSPLLPRVEGTGTVASPAQLSVGPVVESVSSRRRLARPVRARALGRSRSSSRAVSSPAASGAPSATGSMRGTGRRSWPRTAVVPDGRWISDLASIEELMRVADAYDRVVLRVDENGGDAYLVDDGIVVYRFRPARAGALGAPRAFPAHGR